MTTTTHTGRMESLTVGAVAERFGITVRTLHHYDEIGLLVPGDRTHAGYRLYTADDLIRLGAIVTYRRLGLPLTEVRSVLDGDADVMATLTRQKEAVLSQLGELHGLVEAIDRLMEAEMNDQPATEADLKEVFGEGYSEEHMAEAEQRWGDTDAWRQSRARTQRFTKDDWQQVKQEAEAVNAAFVAALEAGLPATSEAAMDAAEQHRLSIHERFYDCSHEFHRNLGDMYVADPRFTQTYDALTPGLAAYVRDAIHANADRHC